MQTMSTENTDFQRFLKKSKDGGHWARVFTGKQRLGGTGRLVHRAPSAFAATPLLRFLSPTRLR